MRGTPGTKKSTEAAWAIDRDDTGMISESEKIKKVAQNADATFANITFIFL
jgi:hypothetical protein